MCSIPKLSNCTDRGRRVCVWGGRSAGTPQVAHVPSSSVSSCANWGGCMPQPAQTYACLSTASRILPSFTAKGTQHTATSHSPRLRPSRARVSASHSLRGCTLEPCAPPRLAAPPPACSPAPSWRSPRSPSPFRRHTPGSRARSVPLSPHGPVFLGRHGHAARPPGAARRSVCRTPLSRVTHPPCPRIAYNSHPV